MSENQNCKMPDFSVYDAMETQELEEILRQDAASTDAQESDIEKILYIAGVLANRENKNNTGNEAQIAWESFEKDYLPMEEDIEYTVPKRVATRSWVRRLTAIAAVFVLLIGLSATVAGAFGWEKVWTAVAKWAKETFSFVSDCNAQLTEPEDRSVQKYASLQDALDATGHRNVLVPTWIPDGYVLDDITIDENPIQRIYIAIYNNGEKRIWITVRSYLNADPAKIEIDEDIVETYKVSDMEYYIFENSQQLRAAWNKDSYECMISGDLTLDELKTMINSIGKG